MNHHFRLAPMLPIACLDQCHTPVAPHRPARGDIGTAMLVVIDGIGRIADPIAPTHTIDGLPLIPIWRNGQAVCAGFTCVLLSGTRNVEQFIAALWVGL